MNSASVKTDWMKIVSNSKQEWDHDECCFKCKKLYGWRFCSDSYIRNPSTCNCECKKCLFGKLVLPCEDEILNTAEASDVDRKVIFEKIIALFTLFQW